MSENSLTLEDAKAIIEYYDFKIITMAEAKKKKTKFPKGIRARIDDMLRAHQKDGGKPSHVLFDPKGKSDGWLLLGKPLDIAIETIDYVKNFEPEDGPLAKKAA